MNKLPDSITDEQRFVLLASRPFVTKGVVKELAKFGESDFDWEFATRLAEKSAVYPLVYENLRLSENPFVPTHVLEFLRTMYIASHRRGLILTYELVKIIERLKDIGVDALSFKGPILATASYGDLKRRVFGDLDIVVPVEQAELTRKFLVDEEFREVDKFPSVVRSSWTSYVPFLHNPHGNANGYIRDPSSPDYLHIDLHWGLAPRFLKLDLPMKELWERKQVVQLVAGAVQTFSDEDTFLLLCLHGIKHAWNELRLFTDMAAFMQSHPRLNWDLIAQFARDAKIVNGIASALKLTEFIMSAPIPAGARRNFPVDEVEGMAQSVVEWRLGHASPVSRLLSGYRYHLGARDKWVLGVGACFAHSKTVSETILARR